MLIKITNRCYENCPHCLDACTPSGYDMPLKEYSQVLKYLQKIGSKLVHLSGGEPTLHPHFIHCVQEAAMQNCRVIISTNFPEASQKALYDIAHRYRNVSTQISSDSRYYQNRHRTLNNELIAKMPRTFVVTNIGDNILPVGRAKGWPTTKKWASCVNTYLVAAQKPGISIGGIVRTLQQNHRYCAPMIDAHGNIRAGESAHCTNLGHFSDPKKVIDTTPCKQCGLKLHIDFLQQHEAEG